MRGDFVQKCQFRLTVRKTLLPGLKKHSPLTKENTVWFNPPAARFSLSAFSCCKRVRKRNTNSYLFCYIYLQSLLEMFNQQLFEILGWRTLKSLQVVFNYLWVCSMALQKCSGGFRLPSSVGCPSKVIG